MMTTRTTPESTPSMAPAWGDDEIDLRAYLLVLIAWWREIALVTLLVAVVAAAAGLLWRTIQPTQYQASADVVIARLTSQFNIDERIATTTETQGVTNASWRVSLLELAQSGALAQDVLADLGDVLPEPMRTADALVGAVELTVPTSADGRTLTDIIRISVSAEAPELAAQIANAWAARFIAHINRVYGDIPVETIDALVGEQAAAKAKFDQAQRALQEFIANSHATTIQRELDDKRELRNQLQAGRAASIATIMNEDQQERTALYGALAGELVDQTVAVLALERQGRQDELVQLYGRLSQTRGQLMQARNFVAQLELGGPAAAATSAQALQLLKIQVFAPQPLSIIADSSSTQAAIPVTIAVPGDSDTPTAPALLDDAKALVAVLEDSVAQLEAEINAKGVDQVSDPAYAIVDLIRTGDLARPDPSRSVTVTAYVSAVTASYLRLFQVGDALGQLSDFGDGGPDALEQLILPLEGQLQELSSQLEAEQSRQRELTQQRDLAWTTYDALSNKLVESNLARTAANSEVRLGSAAVEPNVPVAAPSLRLPVVAATAAAFLAMVLLAFVVNMLGGKPFLSRQ